MQATTNYNLRLPDETDYFNIEDFNYNFNTLDTAVKVASEGSGDLKDNIASNTMNIIAIELHIETTTSADIAGTTDNIVLETFDDANDINISVGYYDAENKRVYA